MYTLEHGSYYQRNPRNGDIEKMCDLVAIAFSNKVQEDGSVMWAVHRHGDPKDVKAWWQKNREDYQDLFGEITIITFPRRFDPDRINAVIENAFRLEALLKEVENEPPRSTSPWDWLS